MLDFLRNSFSGGGVLAPNDGQCSWSTCDGCAEATLDTVRPGATCRIRRLNGCGAARRRLLDLGFQPGREVTMLRSAPLMDPIELRLGDSYIVLRRREASEIEIADA